ncbi:MAG: LPS export ABC transporter periplasmic protein LptC [Candidatus Omnitrophica bacterium CG08_land_8_20_14_0_20_41_16]|uniref:LPS export ABC transporter periplasmic protein LptC n=1 Tax=Candidatus Sherwoodlollariibacterium unditelluris TaxID=1974757 RepID=A0A2G9YKZ0_9BACT|nr:MAG: LPS export ABC transporter periplasmic protein LptC [Candidatus Omnitrophica bacterium CG23_combo_of_CG06-09_8_20_14_all_41_10]PIS33915.1 MAG: LPS export ABC transporter periplasmic protein LptC [Candidatus Omnitrophica bacterium CG08_land_8_20_14_0_20_41_16]
MVFNVKTKKPKNGKTVFLFLSFWIFGFLGACLAASQPAGEADQQISDFSISGYEDKGKKSWDISGKSADIFTEVVKLKDVDGNLYGKEENVNLTAKTGDFNKTDGKVHLEKDVVITTSKGAKLTTNSMDWDRKNQVVTTEDKVNIEKDNIAIVGTGAHGEQSLKKVALNKDVRVDINSEKDSLKELALKDKIIITCDGQLIVDYEKNIASFNDNVKVEKLDLIIYSDKMDLYFMTGDNSAKADKTTKSMANSIDKIIASGNVKIVRGENISYSQEAIYTALDKKVVLSGHPKLVFYSTEEFKNASFGN